MARLRTLFYVGGQGYQVERVEAIRMIKENRFSPLRPDPLLYGKPIHEAEFLAVTVPRTITFTIDDETDQHILDMWLFVLENLTD